MVSVFQIVIWIGFFIGLYLVTFWLLTFVEQRNNPRKKLKKLPRVTIAIPAYNEETHIKKTLESAIQLDYPKSLIEIIVVNDGSSDKTEDIVNKIIIDNPESDINIFSQKNQGKGGALNKALKESNGEFFVVLDADSHVSESALKTMLPSFHDKNVAIVLPLMKIFQPKSFLEKIQWTEYLINFFYKSLMSVLNCVHVAPGPFSIYRKKVLIEIGGFAQKNLTEDLEVTLRIQKAQYKIVQRLDAEVYTSAPDSISGFYKQRNRWYKGTMFNMFAYKGMVFNKKYGDFGILQMPRVFISGFLAVTFLSLVFYKYVLKNGLDKLYNISKVNFDFPAIIRNYKFSFDWYGIDFTNILFIIVSLTITGIVIFYTHKLMKEKMLRYGIFSLPAYMLLYGIMVSGVWLGVFIEILLKRRQKW